MYALIVFLGILFLIFSIIFLIFKKENKTVEVDFSSEAPYKVESPVAEEPIKNDTLTGTAEVVQIDEVKKKRTYKKKVKTDI